MNARKRLEKLEAGTEQSVEASDWYKNYLWMKRHYFPTLENHRRGQEGLEPLPIPEEEPDPEFDAFWEHFQKTQETYDPQMLRESDDWWHQLRWERYGIPRRTQGLPPIERNDS